MMRKATILVLALTAALTAGLWAVSWVAPQHHGIALKNLSQICNLRSGRIRLDRRENLTTWDDDRCRGLNLWVLDVGRNP